MLATLVSHCPQQSPAMIGMARVVSDGAFNAQLWDVMVDPDFQVGALQYQYDPAGVNCGSCPTLDIYGLLLNRAWDWGGSWSLKL